MTEEYTKCPECGSIEIYYDKRKRKYRCIECGHEMTIRKWLKLSGIPEKEWSQAIKDFVREEL